MIKLLYVFSIFSLIMSNIFCAEPPFQIKYGDFENDFNTYFIPGEKNIIEKIKEGHTGSYSCKIVLNEHPEYLKAKGWLNMKDFEKISGTAGMEFIIEYYAKFNFPEGQRQIRNIIAFFDSNKKPVQVTPPFKSIYLKKADEWQKVSVPFQIQEGSQYVKFSLNAEGGEGDFLLIDDLCVTVPGSREKPKNTAGYLDERLLLFVAEQKNAGITIDGKTNEKFWESLPWISGFTDYKTGAAAIQETKFKITRDSKGIYLAVSAAGENPVTSCSQNQNSGIFGDDIIEIFIGGKQLDEKYRHLVFNSAGFLHSAIGSVSAIIDWTVETGRDQSGYYAEVFIPYSSLDLKNDRIINFNIGREANSGGKREISSWSGIKHSFHNFTDFGNIVLGSSQGKPLSKPQIQIDTVSRKIKVALEFVQDPAGLLCWLHYCHKIEANKYEYLKKPFTFDNNQQAEIPVTDDMDSGSGYITIAREEAKTITAAVISRFDFNKIRAIKIAYDHPVILPVPKKSFWHPGRFNLRKVEKIIYFPSPDGYEQQTAEKIQKYLKPYNISISGIEKETMQLQAGTIILGSLKNTAFKSFLQKTNPKMHETVQGIKTPGQGYALKLDEGTALLAGQDGAGVYYAFITFLQMVRFDPDNVPQVSLLDWPDHERRSLTDLIALYYLRESPYELSERFIFDNLAFNKFNELMVCVSRNTLEFTEGNNVKLNNRRGQKQIYPKENMKKLIKFARENFVTMIPMWEKPDQILDNYPELKEFPGSEDSWNRRVVCTKNPKYYEVLFPVLKEVYETFDKPEVFHIGHDEVRFHSGIDDIYSCRNCGQDSKNSLFINDVIRQAEYLKSLGVKEVRMWSDMLFETWGGGHAPFDQEETVKMRKTLAAEYPYIVPAHWGVPAENIEGVIEGGKGPELLFEAKFRKITWSMTGQIFASYCSERMADFQSVGMNRTGGLLPWVNWMPRDSYGEEKKIANKPKVTKGRSYRDFHEIYRVADILWNCISGNGKIDAEDFPFFYGNAMARFTSARPFGQAAGFTAITLTGREDPAKIWHLPENGFIFSSIKDRIDRSVFKSLYNDGQAVILKDEKKSAALEINSKCRMLALLQTMNIPDEKYEAFRKKTHDIIDEQPRTFEEGKEIGKYLLQYNDGTVHEAPVKLGFNIFFYTHYLFSHHLPLWDTSEIWVINGIPDLAAYIYVIVNPLPDKTIRQLTLQKSEDAAQIALFAAAVLK
ncbi:MAG: hypothetical protein A2096_05580 [Spirochaetes bacterium GWF1_41_5]|nr:MAG: hypothetical protein A2096_05580 [Spirochaetes bacterium GWF1_41_5]